MSKERSEDSSGEPETKQLFIRMNETKKWTHKLSTKAKGHITCINLNEGYCKNTHAQDYILKVVLGH